ncbi:MAG: sodium/solute symporter [Verrucomicrobiota bacterium]
MIRRIRLALIGALFLLIRIVDGSDFAGAEPSVSDPISWTSISRIPDQHGFAGPFAGSLGEYLIVAGGANFPDAPPWDGGAKVWHDRIFVLSPNQDEWLLAEERLPEARAYGVSVSLPERESVVMIGGSDRDNQPTRSVIEVRVEQGKLRIDELPPLPIPLAEMSGVTLNQSIYLFSGRTTRGTAKVALRLDLNANPPKWETLAWPEGARGRMHSVAGARDGMIYLFGGRDRMSEQAARFPEDRFEPEQLDFLRDAYRFDPVSEEWQKLADLPEGLSAAPATAIPAGNSHLLVLGGVAVGFLEKQLAARPEMKGQGHEHPGFPRSVWAYHTITDTWTTASEIPAEFDAPVTVPVIPVGDSTFAIPSGEIKPGVRTTQVMIGEIFPNRSSFGMLNWFVVVSYLLAMVAIGYGFMKREASASTDAYFRGGQRVPWWVAGLSIFATMLSAITFMAIPAKAYAENMNFWIGQWAIVLLVPLVVFFYLPYFRKLNITSAYEFLENRFNLASRLVASALFMIFHLGRVAIVLYLPALALSSATDINIYIAILAIGLLCILYTVMGGIEAVVWTDAIQAIVLVGGALLCFLIIVSRLDGGVATMIEITATDSKGIVADWRSFEFGASTNSGWVIFLGFLFASLPSYTAGQDVVQRYVTTSSEQAAARSLWLNVPLVLLGSFLFFALGIALYAFYKTQPELLDPTLERNDGILPFFILQNLPVGVAGLIVAGIFAAAQSTISSSLNSVATAFVTDYYGRVWKPESQDSIRLRVARIVVILLGVTGIALAASIAATGMKSAFDTFNTFIGMALGPVGGMFFLGVFVTRAQGAAALLGALAGFLTVLAIHLARESGVHDLWPILNGMISFGVTVILGAAIGIVTRRDRAAREA